MYYAQGLMKSKGPNRWQIPGDTWLWHSCSPLGMKMGQKDMEVNKCGNEIFLVGQGHQY